MTRWVVVGAGSAGCVVAARLSEDDANEVTLLEAGPDHLGSFGRPGEPVLDVPELRGDVEVLRRPGGRTEVYAQGRGVGGSSLINGGVVVGDPADEASGHDLPIEPVARIGPAGRAALAASRDAAPVSVVAAGGRRVSVAEAYLHGASGRSNLTVLGGVDVDRVELVDRRAVGVVTAAGELVGADRVVLCAGAVHTPVLLLRSGVDAPGVGEGLQDHVGVVVPFELSVPPEPDAAMIGVTIERHHRQLVVMERLSGDATVGGVLAGHLVVESIGRVRLDERNGAPDVQLRQLTTADDVAGLDRAVADALGLLTTSAFERVVRTVLVDDTTSRALLGEAAARRTWASGRLGGYHHLSGSCRPGTSLRADRSVVGYERLYVCDASALDGVPAANPFLAVVRQAERWTRSMRLR